MASSNDQEQQWISAARAFCERLGTVGDIPENSKKKGVYDHMMVSGPFKVDRIERGRITCVFTVKPPLTNQYNTLHGGVVAAVAEVIALASVRSVAGDKDFFIVELATTYLSAARVNTEVEVEGCIVRHGRSLIISSVEFRDKETGRFLFTGRATFLNMPTASL